MSKSAPTLSVLLIMATVTLASVAVTLGQGDQDDDKLHVVLPRDAIPAISKPEFEPASRVGRGMVNTELVIGVVGEREQRAYSTWQLDRHEIVNDTFDGRPIAVTW